uniref:NADH-ubiquinone oxidoreductase chain 6 n=1 Tax=Cermatobius longicornis TaxID=1273176 RepID=R4IS89_9MYRI|nr:NADH dehydrogenase subunit 6 [Cermatobius longicornis]AGA84609.1 NADH dehydrogenase subunit 6 [Cermatobius longicornis]
MAILMTISIMTSILFTSLSHPVSFISATIAQTLLVALTTSILQKSFWYGYILFLIFLGGMLVLFSYMATLASNERFKLSLNMSFMMPITFTLTLALLYTITPEMTDPLPFTNTTLLMNKFYSQNALLTLIIISYLLITLLIVVKISDISQGPVRSNI